jgi:DNA repair exonuclease SbcCD ATPase subunit
MQIMIDRQNIITIYIHPDKGPISYMQLDMLEIEIKAVNLPPFHSSHDSHRIDEIIAAIKKKFPDVDPESKRRELAHLISRLSQTSMFNGIALRLPGRIDGDGAPPPPDLNTAADEFRRLTQEAITLKRELEDWKRKYDTANALVPSLEKDNDALRELYHKTHEEVEDLRIQLQDADLQINRISAENKKFRDKINQLEVDKAALKTQVEQAARDKKTLLAWQQELAALRESKVNARKLEQQLRETIKRREQDIRDLQARLRRLTDEIDPTIKASDGKDKEPWLDQ